jgi:hypothetical protein
MNLEIQKKTIFEKVISYFNSIAKHRVDYNIEHINLCQECHIPIFIEMAELLQRKYRYLSIRDSYITIVYTFFLLNLSEPNEETILVSINEYNEYADDPNMVSFLFFAITTNEIINENGINISSKIRRKIFGME